MLPLTTVVALCNDTETQNGSSAAAAKQRLNWIRKYTTKRGESDSYADGVSTTFDYEIAGNNNLLFYSSTLQDEL